MFNMWLLNHSFVFRWFRVTRVISFSCAPIIHLYFTLKFYMIRLNDLHLIRLFFHVCGCSTIHLFSLETFTRVIHLDLGFLFDLCIFMWFNTQLIYFRMFFFSSRSFVCSKKKKKRKRLITWLVYYHMGYFFPLACDLFPHCLTQDYVLLIWVILLRLIYFHVNVYNSFVSTCDLKWFIFEMIHSYIGPVIVFTWFIFLHIWSNHVHTVPGVYLIHF